MLHPNPYTIPGAPGGTQTYEIPWWDSNPHITPGSDASAPQSSTQIHKTLNGIWTHAGVTIRGHWED